MNSRKHPAQVHVQALAELDRKLKEAQKSLDAGKGRPAKEVFDEVEARLRQRIAARSSK